MMMAVAPVTRDRLTRVNSTLAAPIPLPAGLSLCRWLVPVALSWEANNLNPYEGNQYVVSKVRNPLQIEILVRSHDRDSRTTETGP